MLRSSESWDSAIFRRLFPAKLAPFREDAPPNLLVRHFPGLRHNRSTEWCLVRGPAAVYRTVNKGLLEVRAPERTEALRAARRLALLP